ncbi:MAG: ribonuclease Z [Anaerolineae bacterium]|nr:ribonuclease Z [Anaerolineae bacterium]
MFELVFLGTSASAPSVHRGLSSAMVLYQEYRFLVDCGEGTQRQLLRSGLGFRRLDRILLTHGHLDHILGLGGILSTFERWEAVEHVEIWGGRWALNRVERLMDVVFGPHRRPLEIALYDVHAGLLMEDETFALEAFPVVHRGPGCYGYVFSEKARRPFLAEQAEALGVPRGPERARLVRGEDVVLADGMVVRPGQVLGPEVPGARLVFVGDAGSTEGLIEVAHRADALVIEATYLERERDLARDFGHLTAQKAAELARDAEVEALILTHLSRRYHEREVLEEAQAVFARTFVARDFDLFRVGKGGDVEHVRKAESGPPGVAR